MTVSTEDFRWTYTSTGGTTYQYLNKILTQDDLTVYASSVLKTVGTDYTVDGVGDDAGGNVVFLAAPAAGTTILITKDGVAFTQDHDYTENDPFPAASHEDALDKQTNLAQKIWDYVRRSVKVAITSTLTDLELPTPSAGKYLGWNDTGTGFSNLVPTALGVISDDAYGSAAWDGASEVAPSKNAVRDKIELMVADIDTLEADVASLVSDTAYSSTSWDGATEVAPSKNAVRDILEKGITGNIVQVVSYATGSYASGTTQMVTDDTPPLQTEGDEYMQLTITPKSASNYLKIDVTGMWSNSVNTNIGVALFQDSIATGLAAVNSWVGLANYYSQIYLSHYTVASTTTSTTFKVRAGASDGGGGTTYFNGNAGRKFGGKSASSITIWEIAG